MKTIKTALFIACLFFEIQICFSQNNVSYVYDAAGNRTNRTINMPVMKSSTQPDTLKETPTVLSEILADLHINIYPNPTEGNIRVDIQGLSKGETAGLNLYSLAGALIQSRKNVSSSAEINISGQPTGIYILKIVVGKQQSEWKIIKK